MKCDDINPKLTAYLLGDLDEREAAEVREHLETCDACRALAEETEPTLALLCGALAGSLQAPQRLSAGHRRRISRSVLGEESGRRALHWLTLGHPRLALAASIVAVCGFMWLAIQGMRGTVRRERTAGAESRPSSVSTPTADMERGGPPPPETVVDGRSRVKNALVPDSVLPAQPPPPPREPAPALEDTKTVGGYARLGSSDEEREERNLTVREPADIVATANMRSQKIGPPPASGPAPARRPPPVPATLPPADGSRPTDSPKDIGASLGKLAEPAAKPVPTVPDEPRPDPEAPRELHASELSPVAARLSAEGERRRREASIAAKEEAEGRGLRQDGLLWAERDKQKASAKKEYEFDDRDEVVMSEGDKQSVAEDEPTAPRFRAFGVNPFVDAAENAFSTFSIDVDTAAYTLSRNYMLRGLLPPADAVRTEEFVNFFDYGDKAPAKEAFRVYTEAAPSTFGRGLHLLRIGVKGKRLGREEQRRAVLTFAIDTSGSMEQPDRIGLVKAALKLLVSTLNPDDEVAIVQYGSKARLVLEHTPASAAETIVAALDRLQCGGSTNLGEGMERAYALAARRFAAGAENRVLLLSDGVANLGTDRAEDILASIAAYRRRGITCSVFGFGMGTYDDAMLETLANKGDGVYAFIDSIGEARRVFVDDLSATLNTIATDVKIQVEFNPRLVRRYRQLGYENRQLRKQDFRDDAVDAGEVGSGQSVTALYELELTGVRGNRAARRRLALATVRVRYRRSDNGRVEEIEHPVRLGDVAPAFDQAPATFRLAAAVAEFAEILRGSPHAAGSRFADVADALRPVALDLEHDTRVQELLRLVIAAPGLSRAPGE